MQAMIIYRASRNKVLLLGSTKAVQALGLSRAQLFFLLRIIINGIAGRGKRFRRGSGVRLSGRDSENDRSDDGEKESEPWDDSHQPHYRKAQQQNPSVGRERTLTILYPLIHTRNAKSFLHRTYHRLRHRYPSNRSRHASAARMEVEVERYEAGKDPYST